jgi:hypothetical protein
MRLLNTDSIRLTLFDKDTLPKYAILSHRWGEQEVSFQELEAGLGKEKNGYQKILSFCDVAKRDGYEWCWVDTCALYRPTTGKNALLKGWHMPLKRAGVGT